MNAERKNANFHTFLTKNSAIALVNVNPVQTELIGVRVDVNVFASAILVQKILKEIRKLVNANVKSKHVPLRLFGAIVHANVNVWNKLASLGTFLTRINASVLHNQLCNMYLRIIREIKFLTNLVIWT